MKLVVKSSNNLLELSIILYTFAIAFSSDTGVMTVKIARLIVVGAFLFELIRKQVLRIHVAPYILWCLSVGAFGWLSCVWAVSRNLAYESAITQTYIIVINCLIAYALFNNADFIYLLMKTIVFSAILHGLRVYLTHGFTVYLNHRGGTEDVENANVLANVACFGLIFAVVILRLRLAEFKWLYIGAIAANSVFALLTASRKIFVYIGVFFAIYYIFNSKNPLILIRNAIIITVCGIIVLYAVLKIPSLYELIGERIMTMISGLLGGDTDGSTSFRMSLIRWGMEWFKEKPILGYGLNCYKYLLGSTYDTWVGKSGVYAHNNYVELLVDLGIVGTILYYSLYVKTIIRSFRLSRRGNHLAVIALSIIMVFVVGEYGQVTHMNVFLQLVLLMSWFMACGYNKKTVA